MPDTPKAISIGEAAAILGRSVKTVRTLVDRGRLPCKRDPINGFRTFNPEDVYRLLKALRATDWLNSETLTRKHQPTPRKQKR